MTTHTWTCKAGNYAVHSAVHMEGEGQQRGRPPLLLIHGIGPGTSVHANFGTAMPKLAEQRTIHGLDLIGFGASARPGALAAFDFAAWVEQARDAISRIDAPEIHVWGQSLGAAVSLAASASDPRVRRIVCTGSGGGARELNEPLARFWTTPDTPDQLREAMAGAVYDASRLSTEQVAQRFATLQAGAGEAFRAMMAGDREAHLQSCWLSPGLLRAVKADVLLIHGREDHCVPYKASALHLADHIERSTLVLLGQCGHNPIIERAQDVLRMALNHLDA